MSRHNACSVPRHQQTCKFLGHALTDPLEHGGATRRWRADVNVVLHESILAGTGLLGSGKLVGFHLVGTLCCGHQLGIKIERNVAKLLLCSRGNGRGSSAQYLYPALGWRSHSH